jgi:hypothetical protein
MPYLVVMLADKEIWNVRVVLLILRARPFPHLCSADLNLGSHIILYPHPYQVMFFSIYFG